MRWPMWRRPAPPLEETEQARWEAKRALEDAYNFDRRADAAAERFERTKRRNHIAEAIETVIRPAAKPRSVEQ